jgi:endonuclease/exonuclease/phosphatase family metal-dependent hydrolase
MVRILTYNVHRCVGLDRRMDVGRVAQVIAAEAPDIVALQEVDVGRARTGRVDQAHALARRLGMASRFHAALRVEEEQYGDAILTALPERLIRAGPLPGYARIPQLEPRGALWVGIDLGEGRELQVINTHLGLAPAEQQNQARALVGPDWLGAAQRRDPLLMVGDFNATSRTLAHRILAASLANAHRLKPAREPRAATFPARMPVLRIDHCFISGGIKVRSLRVGASPLARVASDHLPLVMDFEIEGMEGIGTVQAAGG